MKEYSKSVVLCSLFKLLLIEDDESLFQEIKDILTQWSYEVYGVTDFGNVIQEFTAIKPDLVIIDIQLPKFDGFHWCRMIRSHSNVPILFLSSRDHPTDMVMSMQLGGDDFDRAILEDIIADIDAIELADKLKDSTFNNVFKNYYNTVTKQKRKDILH